MLKNKFLFMEQMIRLYLLNLVNHMLKQKDHSRKMLDFTLFQKHLILS
jgi:hypothetical protein